MPSPVALLASTLGVLVLSVEGEPTFSRTSIVAVRAQGNDNQLWMLRPSGQELRRVGATISAISRPSWSLDGKSILYTERSDARADLYLLPVRGGRKTLLSREPGLNAEAKLAPDGTAIALTLTRDGNSEIYTLSRGQLKRLTNTWELDGAPTWSPSSEQLAFVSARLGAAEIFVMNRDGSNAQPLTSLGLHAQNPDWSPVGDRIVFSAREGQGKADIWMVDVNTRAAVRLTNSPGLDVEPSFSPDGRWIVFVSDRSGTRDLWIMRAEGGEARRITKDGDYAMPAWSPLGRDSLAGRDERPGSSPLEPAAVRGAHKNGGP